MGGRFGAGVEEGFDGGGVVSFVAFPAVFGAVDGPVHGCAVEFVVVVFKFGGVLEEEANHFGVAVPGSPVKRCGIVLAAGCGGKAGFEHETDGGKVIVAGGVGELR